MRPDIIRLPRSALFHDSGTAVIMDIFVFMTKREVATVLEECRPRKMEAANPLHVERAIVASATIPFAKSHCCVAVV